MQLLIIACFAAMAAARPSFIAVPADQIAFVDLSRVHMRVPRQTLVPPPLPPQLPQALYNQEEEYQPVALPQYHQQAIGVPHPEAHHHPARLVAIEQQQQPQDVNSAASLGASQRLAERPPDFGEYVDFGAHTGDNGAFGWYADYPINQYQDHSRF